MGDQRVLLRAVPEGAPAAEHFECVDGAVPSPGEGQVLVRNRWLSLDPYMRGLISGRHLGRRVLPGEVMPGETVGEVVESRSPLFQPGQRVRGMLGWRRFAAVQATQLAPLQAAIEPPTLALSLLGMPGLTAYAGLIWQAQPQPGETLVVAAATGAVGAMVVQLARHAGCRVVAIAGGAKKCRYAVEELGAEACIDRYSEDLPSRLDALCPNGIDIYFDLVGGALLQHASERLAVNARVVLCGLSADYNRVADTPPAGPSPALWIRARARVHGLVVYDFEHRRGEFIEACLPLVQSGALRIREDVANGLAEAPAAFARLMAGQHFGKVLVRID